MIIAEGFGALAADLQRVLAIAAFATLLLSLAAAGHGAQHGAQQGATLQHKVSALLCGCVGGFAVAGIVGYMLLDANLLAGFVLGPVFGGAASYWIARMVAKQSEE